MTTSATHPPPFEARRSATPAAVADWLEAFASAVRAGDFETGSRLFANHVVAFGTVGTLLNGLDHLRQDQWEKVWTVTSGYRFDLTRLTCDVRGDLAWIAVPWASQGRRDDGTCFDRHGRATYILQFIGGRWLAVHSHHSLNPVA